MKGKDMILSDFLSRQGNDDSDPGEILPISFNAYNILGEDENLGMHKKNEGNFFNTNAFSSQNKWHYTPGGTWG